MHEEDVKIQTTLPADCAKGVDYPTSEFEKRYTRLAVTGNLVSNAPSYIWESSHPIFDGLITYSAPTLNVSDVAFFSIDGVTFSTYGNATAFTGATSTEQEGNVSIMMTNNGQTILNGFMLNNLYGAVLLLFSLTSFFCKINDTSSPSVNNMFFFYLRLNSSVRHIGT